MEINSNQTVYSIILNIHWYTPRTIPRSEHRKNTVTAGNHHNGLIPSIPYSLTSISLSSTSEKFPSASRPAPTQQTPALHPQPGRLQLSSRLDRLSATACSSAGELRVTNATTITTRIPPHPPPQSFPPSCLAPPQMQPASRPQAPTPTLNPAPRRTSSPASWPTPTPTHRPRAPPPPGPAAAPRRPRRRSSGCEHRPAPPG